MEAISYILQQIKVAMRQGPANRDESSSSHVLGAPRGRISDLRTATVYHTLFAIGGAATGR